MGFGALTLLFVVMMVFSRLDGATQVRKKSSIRSELPQVIFLLFLFLVAILELVFAYK
jgi:hypothetical protein